MDLQTSIADDFDMVADWLKPITIQSVSLDALRRAVSSKELSASGGKLLVSDTVFHFSAAKYSDSPTVGQTIADVDGNWTIIEVGKQTFVNRWKCFCRKLFIDDIPANRVTIQTATYAKGATGAEEPTWSTTGTNVLAIIQLGASTSEVVNINRSERTAVVVRFTQDMSLTAGTRIIASDGTVLKVLSWDGFNSAAEQYFTATCEVSIWPQS